MTGKMRSSLDGRFTLKSGRSKRWEQMIFRGRFRPQAASAMSGKAAYSRPLTRQFEGAETGDLIVWASP